MTISPHCILQYYLNSQSINAGGLAGLAKCGFSPQTLKRLANGRYDWDECIVHIDEEHKNGIFEHFMADHDKKIEQIEKYESRMLTAIRRAVRK